MLRPCGPAGKSVHIAIPILSTELEYFKMHGFNYTADVVANGFEQAELETAADARLCVRQIPTKLHLAPAATALHLMQDLPVVQEAAGEAPAGRPEVRGRAPPAAL